MTDLVLYNYFRSSTSYRVRIALNFKGLTYKYIPVHLLNDGGEQNKDSYKSLNPMGEVPTLVHEGKEIAQSAAIIDYLDHVFPQNPLFPKDPFQRAKVWQICENINAGIHPIQNLKVMNRLSEQFGANQDQKDEWLKFWIQKGLAATESLVSKTTGQFSFGNHVTAADLFIVPQLFSAERFKVPLDRYPNLIRISETCLKLKPFQDAHPYKQPDTPEELKIK